MIWSGIYLSLDCVFLWVGFILRQWSLERDLNSRFKKTKKPKRVCQFIPEHGAVPSLLCIQSYLARITDYIECHFIFAMSYDLSKLEIELKI